MIDTYTPYGVLAHDDADKLLMPAELSRGKAM